jgi:16S rRNA (guanine527-N7)-methyltransferase
VQIRAEEWSERETFDVVTGRAVAPLAIQLEISAGFCRLGGQVIPLRTPTDDFMPAGAGILGLRLGTVHELPLPQTDIIRAFPVYEKRSATHKRYPRRWAEIKAMPLW